MPRKTNKQPDVEVKVHERCKLGIVTTSFGRVYACTWAPDTDLTTENVLDTWRNDREAFRPYSTVHGHYISGT